MVLEKMRELEGLRATPESSQVFGANAAVFAWVSGELKTP